MSKGRRPAWDPPACEDRDSESEDGHSVPSKERRGLREHKTQSLGKTDRLRARPWDREGRPQSGNGCAPARRQEVKLPEVWGSQTSGRDRARPLLSPLRVVSARARPRPPQVAAASAKSAPDSKSAPRARTGPAGVRLRNAAGLPPGPRWTGKTRMLRNAHPGSLWLLRLRTAWALLLLAAADGGAGLPKAVVRLEPPWFNVLLGDNVTLHCQGPHGPGDGPTQWSHDGTPIPTQVQPRFSFQASINDNGNYRCQTGQTSLSDPVRLNVTSDWLLLQTPSLLLQEGDPLLLRCHSWKNWPLFKILFLQDGISKWYSPANSSFFIPHANVTHSGKYHCSGLIRRVKHESQPVSITVQGASRHSDSSLVTITVAVVAGIAAVAGVAAVVAWVCLRQRQSSGAPESREVGETPPEEPANLTHAEEAAKAEAENTITYSLLMHPEEDAGLSDYQNM
ncbi:low affinity immunoglobulin gamma Fc region receptor II-like isoform 2-T4 [Glossophaga mutica]